MKYKTTAKAIRENGGRTLATGYCAIQHLLWYTPATAYTCGVYGWNFDVYEVDGVTITTGYRGMVGASVSYELAKEYDKKARAVIENSNLTYNQKRAVVGRLLRNFIKKALQEV